MGDQSDNGFTFEGRDITSLFLRYAQEFMYYLSPSGTVNYISPNWTNIVGHEPGTVMGKDFRTFIHPGSVSSCDIAFKKVIKGQSEKEYIEYKFKHKCGQLCWHQASCVPQRDDSGNIVQIICIGRDITRQKQVESRLDNSQKQLLSVLDSIDTPIYVSDMDTYELLFVNGAIIRLYDGKIPDAPCYKVLQNLDAPCPFCTNDIIRKTDGLVYRWEHNNIMLNKTFDLMDRVIDWPDGRKVRIEHAVDITDMKKNARLLEAEKERLSVTLRSIGDGVITTDMQGRVMILNRVAEELTGWKQEEAVGRPLEEIFHIINEITRKPHENPVAKVLTTGGIIELANHTLLISRDGTERIIADSGAPIKDKQGKTHGVVLVFRDMTEKTRFIEMTQNAQKLESLGIMAGGIAHDFNNLLAGIFGFIDLAHSASSEDIVKSHLGTALSTIDRARALSGQLLTFAKGGVPKVTVNPLFPMVYEAVRFALSGTKISSEFQVASKLWLLEYDKNQLAQVIENLVINAHQAMPHGGTVQISAENVEIAENESTLLDGGKYVKLEIKDKGIGIPKEQLNRIFDPFYTTKNMGHGLGLTTCYSIITRHGGYIFADSQLGQGTTISIYLPAYIENKTDKSGDSVQSVVGKGLILLMDDEQVVQQTTSMMLRQMGFEVLIMSNGSQVIEYYEQIKYGAQKPVAMIFDLTVPGAMGGKEAIRIIRGMDSDIPVLVSSGYCEDPVMMEPEKYGFNARLNKPFRKKDLEQALNILFKGVNIHQ